MIPLCLQLRNFLSYGSDLQKIDFSPYQLICFSGKNGHGKSAILDAITWCLWGQARKLSNTVKADAGLIRLGQTQMLVILDFLLDKQSYRVRREYTISYGKSYTLLEFGVLDKETGQMVSLANKTIRKTQVKIEKTIRLNFSSFCNSAFLRQGHSNEFSQKSSKERKEVLATILGVTQYELLRKKALEIVRAIELECKSMRTIRERCERELHEYSSVVSSIQEVEKKLQAIRVEGKNQTTDYELLEREKKWLNKEQEQYRVTQFSIKQQEQSRCEQEVIVREMVMKWRIINKELCTVPDGSRLILERKNLLQSIEEHHNDFVNSLKYKETLLSLKKESYAIEQEYERRYMALSSEKKLLCSKLESEYQTVNAMKNELLTEQTELINGNFRYKIKQETLDQDLQKLLVNGELLTQQKTKFDRRKDYYHTFVTRGILLDKELRQLEQKQIINNEECGHQCPLCEQDLSPSRRKFLKDKFEISTQLLQQRIQRLHHVTKNLKTILQNDYIILSREEKYREQQRAITTKIQEIKIFYTSSQQDVQKSKKLVDECKKKLMYLQNQVKKSRIKFKISELEKDTGLQKNEKYCALLLKISTFEEKLKTQLYNSTQHQKDSKQLETIERLCVVWEKNKTESVMQLERKKNIISFLGQLKILKSHLFLLSQKFSAYTELTAKEELLLLKEQSIKKKLSNLTLQKEVLLKEYGKLNAYRQSLAKTEKEYVEFGKKIKSSLRLKEEYTAIAMALGKDGIQALLIEETIPEIEQEANAILAKLTDNNSHIMFESLRDLKKGGTKETLDIAISDTVGIRPYELFSGGEAFRIDFALRIAISKLLARRAGSSLQTLIVDEGFGSQDAEGLSYIMDAIYRIQDDFSKIIIVSHLPAMKNQFPVHFVVEKHATGSVVRVEEYG